jgi:signal transduction histidine kinase
MSVRTLHSPLVGRLVGLHLFWVLAGLLTCVAVAFTLFWRHQLTELAAFVAVVPLVLALLGSRQLRRTLGVTADIDAQLLQAASVSALSDLGLRPVQGTNDAARGWNTIVDRVTGASAFHRLETHLSDVLNRVDENKLEQVLNSLPDGIAVTNSDGRITHCNKAFASLARAAGETGPIGKPPSEVLALDGVPNAADIRRIQQETLRVIVFQVQYGSQLTDGVLRIARHPLVDGDERGATHVWTVRDVTQQKLAEEMRNQFVSTATHELRTPLSNIKAYAETLANHDDISAEQQRDFYNIISAEATRLSRFVDELLNVSQMESGALSLTLHETDLARLVEEVAEHVQPEIRRKEIAFELRVPPKLPKLQADKDKLSAALVNLLGNAVKYTAERGRVGLQIEVDHREVHFHVEDTGFGVSPEELPNLFTKFFRSADDRVQAVNGSGLGLAFTQEAARLHGGRVTVHSELNKGSRFTMTLPLAV